MTLQLKGTTALVTGASSGLGIAYATEFARRGADVVLVARREDRLRELADRLGSEFRVTATVISADLAAPGAASALKAETDARGIRIHALVNNAGFGMHDDFIDADAERTAEMIDLNVNALVALTREFLPAMVTARSGVVVNISSTGAFQPCPGMAVYAATKAFVLSFTEALSYEVRHSGVQVLAVCPGATATEFRQVSGLHAERMSESGSQTADQVIAATFKALDGGRKGSMVSGASNKTLAVLTRFVPRRTATSMAARVLS
ncbi:SDR family NAD(P)-dependent oxidoreductase [Microbacterium sp. ASV49]|uniref:SDR family oxidoreductase n=1 Tax=Microbacterium candidum TaxID=3041922 RepID=A0ABT7MVK6_9MICO|nr:SDR family oxidoreductase [Microbacterium sp. ASV49]MDL9978490.1 SDR family oxidoreductase [Microbacterium sp. ASV49]